VTNVFDYDDLYRLSTATVEGISYAWTFDNVGNRLTQSAGGVGTTYSHNAANRLTAVNGMVVTHDANGSLTACGSDTFSWDVRNRLAGMTRTGLTASFSYDFADRRAAKTLNGSTTTFRCDGDDVVSEIAGSATRFTLQGPVVDEPLAQFEGVLPNGLYFTPNHAKEGRQRS
jgi:uncharacterized protein RhaS with RHS repeats